MAHQYIFTMHKLTKTYPPDKTVLSDVSLSFYPGAKIGVLGYNGAGKSSVLKIMAGQDEDYRGDAELAPGASVGLLEQEPQLDPEKDVKGNVEEARWRNARAARPLQRTRPPTTPMRRRRSSADLQAKIDAADAWNLDTQLEYAMDALRLPPSDADVTKLSGGERRRVALCRLLLTAPDLLLLDEPTNHLDAESVGWLERHLAEYKGAVVAVTHDRYFLDNVAGWILELDRGRGLPYEGNYSSWLEQKQARLSQEGKQEKARQKTINSELEWVRENPKGRRKKAKARISNYEELLGARGRGTARSSSDPHPRRATARRRCCRSEGSEEGLWRQAADRGPQLLAAARRNRRRDRPQRRRQDDALQDDHRRGDSPTPASLRSARRCKSPPLTKAATRSTTTRPSGKRSAAATSRSWSASAR